jgi:uncharacterized protein (DUF362 family)
MLQRFSGMEPLMDHTDRVTASTGPSPIGNPKVAVLKTQPDAVLDDIARLMTLADVERCLPKDRPVILKSNISWHMPFLSANTTPWQLEGVIRCLRDLGYKDIVSVENETVVTNAQKGERLNRHTAVLKKYGVKALYNFRKEDMKWETYEPKGTLRVLHTIFPKGVRIPDYFHGKNILPLPTVKCHIYTGMTGSMKNAFGGLLNTRRHYTHSVIHETLVDLLMIQQEIHTGIFTVMDGTVCGDGAGPRTMTPVVKDYLLASGDSVAIDAVASRLMGFNPADIGCIRMASEDGLGVGDVARINVVGENIDGVNFGFRQTENMASLVGKPLWFGPLRGLQKLFFHTPLVYAFVFGSFLYHDYIWWPTKGQQRMKEIADTPWGRLFNRYEI